MVRVICEGTSDVKQIKSILKFLDIKFQEQNFIFTNGKSFLLDSSIPKYKTLLEHIENGFVSKIEILQKSLNIETISDYYLACDPISKKGYFESLLLSTVDKEVIKCYEEFKTCSALNSKAVDKNILTELHNLTKPEKPYDFNHENFNELKIKLKNLFKDELK